MEERREFPRFKIPGARVVFYQEEGFKGSEAIVDEGLMEDCSLTGLRFETDKKLVQGAKVRVELVIKGKKTIPINGNIIWLSNISDKNKTYAHVGFLPFADSPGSNSLETRSELENIADEFEMVY